jgi:hypothetical protein
MKVIWQHGGLGNQLFATALYLKYESMGHKVYMDISHFDKLYVHDGFIVNVLFDIDINFAKLENVNLLVYGINTKNKFLSSILNMIPQRVFSIIGRSKVFSQYKMGQYYTYYDSIFNNRDQYLLGHWQNTQYFNDIKNLLLEKFKVRYELLDSLSPYNKNLMLKIRKSNSVCVHVRGGDFIGGIHETVDYSYYIDAIQFIQNKFSNLKFFFFSDDHLLVNSMVNKLLFLQLDYFIVLKGTTIDDFILMSEANHYIIPNSTFSWWAAYLNKNKDKVIIIPKFWTKDDLDASMNIKDDEWVIL